MNGLRAGTLGVVIVASALGAHARQQGQPLGAVTTAVVIDVVVRDTRGRPVTNLTRADFELLEDGVRQEIGDLTRVGVGPPPAARPAGAPAGAGSGSATVATPRAARTTVAAPTFVALVFDRLSPEARVLSHKAALAYLTTSHEDDFAGVFLSDLSLVPIQQYTNDRTALRKALDDVASRATSVFDRRATTDDLGTLTTGVGTAGGDFSPGTPVVASPESAGRPAIETGLGLAVPTMPAAVAAFRGASDAWERMARDQQGDASVNALRAVVEGLGRLPGRKTAIFFAEALALPDAVMPQFDGLVALANRVNVSVYTIDAAGLRVDSKDQESAREINPRTSLTLLAERTGGFLIENTNDLSAGFRRIDADRRFHYLLTYTPKNTDFGGEWRKVEVRIPGRTVEIRSRSGYPAVRSLSAIPLLAYEGPALAALERTAPPAELPVRLGAFVFPLAGGGSRVALLVAASGETLTFQPTPEGFRTDFTLLARVKDASGAIVRQGSQPYRLTGPAADLERTQKGEVLFYRQPDLPPGQYVLEGVVHDALTPRAGVARMPLDVPADAGLRVSSLMIVSRADRLMTGELNPDNPLQVGDRLMYPNLGQTLQRRRAETVAFFATIVPSGTAPVAARLQVLQTGRLVAELPVSLNAPDAAGRIQQVSQVPAGGLGTGNHVFRLVITQGAQQQTREVGFRVEIVE